MIPNRLFLTKGVGKHYDKLTSFEAALRSAGIASLNLVKVSSILPPYCKIITRTQAWKILSPGEVVYCVLAQNSTNEPNRLIASSIGLAIPKDRSLYGYLSEFESFGMTEKEAGDYAEDLAAQMLASTLGVEFDPEKSYDERKEIWKISGKFYKTMNITQSAIGAKNGLWTTVVAAAVFVPPSEKKK
ncbi:MAG: pyruvoyl-dependent arginine decarboxylase [bacterium JZ-2024 1]